MTPDCVSDPIRCPDCKQQDLEISGEVGHDFSETWRSGTRIAYSVDRTETHQTIRRIYCYSCNVEWIIESEYTRDLRLQVTQLQLTLDFSQRPSLTVH